MLDPPPTTSESLRAELELVEAGRLRAWQSVLIEIYPVVPKLWSALTPASKASFLDGLYSLWMMYLAAFPALSARRILSLMDRGQLDVQPGLRHVEAADDGFRLHLATGAELSAAVVVNGCGPGYDVSVSGGPLLQSLVNKGLGQASPFGGLAVAPTSLELVSASGEASVGLFAVGDLTRGEWLATADVAQSVRQTRRLMDSIEEVLLR